MHPSTHLMRSLVAIAVLSSPLSAQSLVELAGGGPGSLQFSLAGYSATEGGTVTVTVTRTGGDDGAVSVGYATSDGSALAGADYTPSFGTLSWPDNDDFSRTFQIQLVDDGVAESTESFTVALATPGGGATLGSPATATITVIDNDTGGGPCMPSSTTLCLNQQRFAVRMSWTDFAGTPHQAVARPETADTGFFYYTDPNNLEVMVKILNACGVNGKFWVFFAAATNVGYDITVTDTLRGIVKPPYHNPLGTFGPAVGDTLAFDCQ